MIITENETDDLRTFDCGSSREVTSFAHSRQDASLHRFQAVACIWQGTICHDGETVGGKGLRHDNGKIFFANDASFYSIIILCSSRHILNIQFLNFASMFGQEG